MKQILLSLLLLVWATMAMAGSGAGASPSLARVLNPDGTLRPGAAGSFDAGQLALYTAPDGRPAFRPAGAGDACWQSTGDSGQPGGANSQVSAVVRSGTTMYIGGYFSTAGATLASKVAKWDGMAWSSLGSGITGNVVKALALAPNGDLYVGGDFTQAGGVPASSVARWNGTAWSSLGSGVNGTVSALTVAPNGDLYVGGDFTQAGSVSAYCIARWNGSNWSNLGTGMSGGGLNGTTRVHALALAPTGDLYAGGFFDQAGGVPANRIARWNGTAWSSLGTGVNGSTVGALAVGPTGDLYVGGDFTQAGGAPANFVSRWNGTTWSDMGPATMGSASSGVYALAVAANGDVYIGGSFSFGGAGGVWIDNVAKWDGTTWSGLGPVSARRQGPDNAVIALALNGSAGLAVGGDFISAGRLPANHFTMWNGTTWSGVGTIVPTGLHGGLVMAVAAAATGDVYVGGSFTHAGITLTNQIAKWDGSTWSSLGTGLDGLVQALALAPNGDVYAGGAFTQAGGLAAANVARWDGTAWHALGTGINGTIAAIAVGPNGEVYVGGDFTAASGLPAHGIARWNGTAWSNIGTSLYDQATNLAVAADGDVYASGRIQGNTSLARWDGTGWRALGGNGFGESITGMALAANGDVYISSYRGSGLGQPPLTTIRGLSGISWTTLATGMTTYGSKLAIGTNGDLFTAGAFYQIDGHVVNNIARWDGVTWSSLGTGLNREVTALATDPAGRVYAGGTFTAVGDGSKELAAFTIYDCNATLATRGPATAASMTLFPNPAHAEVTVQLPAAYPQPPLLLTDELGRTVRQYAAPASSTALLNVRGLPAGVYFVRSGRFTQRLVVR